MLSVAAGSETASVVWSRTQGEGLLTLARFSSRQQPECKSVQRQAPRQATTELCVCVQEREGGDAMREGREGGREGRREGDRVSAWVCLW